MLRLLCVCAHLTLGRGLLLRGPTSRPVIRGRRPYPPRMDTSEDLATEVSYTVTLLSSIRDVKRKDWDALALPAASPFVEWDWLHALEASGCACAETGWTPYHLVVCSPGTTKLVAAMPLYLKSHSMGDFVDDQQWADEARQGGANYYPKLVSAVPFTPCQGSRVLMSEALSSGVRAQLLVLLARYLRTLAEQNGVSSVHVNFCTKEEAAVFAQAGFHHRTGLQYHWHNNAPPAANASASTELTHTPRPYRDFDDFLGGFRSKKRLKIRRERQAVGAELDMEEVRGEEITPELLSLAFHMYKRTVDERLLGRQYLNEKFFMMLAERYRHRLCLILVRRRTDGQLIAATLNVQKDDVFYGRYWGSSHKRQFLHFEACYYTPIQLAIERGWQRVEVGAGTSEYKFSRGFEPSLVHSVHWMRDEGLQSSVAAHVARQHEALSAMLRRLRTHAVLRERLPERLRAGARLEQANGDSGLDEKLGEAAPLG